MQRITLAAIWPFFVLAGTACNPSVFSDLEERAPASRIAQSGEVRSGSFGDGLLGLDRGEAQTGGALFVAANGDAALATILITAAGGITQVQSDQDRIKEDLESPSRINSLAAAPADRGASPGPNAYLASVAEGLGSVRVVDTNRFVKQGPTLRALDTWSPRVQDFGLAVAAVDLGGSGGLDDLVVGARNALVLLRAEEDGWPRMEESAPLILSSDLPGSGWPKGEFKVLVVGELDPGSAGNEVVAAAPAENRVIVIHGAPACFQDLAQPCKSFFSLEPPPGAKGFGAALLITDLDGDGRGELVVGAPDSDQVFVYRFDAAHFAPGAAAPGPLTPHLQGDPSSGFGSALALGRFTDDKPLLAVGAPASVVDGVSNAGRVHLFTASRLAAGDTMENNPVNLVKPSANTLLGRRLSVLPFRATGQRLDVLVAGGREAVFVFFAGLVPGHTDRRER